MVVQQFVLHPFPRFGIGASGDLSVRLSVNNQVTVVFPEDVGTIDVAVNLSGPRTENTTVHISISNSDATGKLESHKKKKTCVKSLGNK